MNLHLLRTFSALVSTGSFSRAALALFISQPAVSKGVQQLERELGTSLLDRSAHGVALTEAGHVLYDYAQRIFASEKAVEMALAELKGLARGHLVIGASQTIGTYLLPQLLGAFHQRYPGVRLSLEIANTQQVIDSLRRTPLNIAYVEGPVRGDDLGVSIWRTDQMVVIAPPHHPLAGHTAVSLKTLAQEPYLQREPGSGTGDIIARAFAERGLALNIAMELGSNQAIKQAVSAGLGISIVSEATIALERASGTLSVIGVRDFQLGRPLFCVQIRDRPASRAALAFQTLLSGASEAA